MNKSSNFKIVNNKGHEFVENGDVLRHYFVEPPCGDVYNPKQLSDVLNRLQEERLLTERMVPICVG